MVTIIGEHNERHSMDVLSLEQIELVKKIAHEMDRHTFLSGINYETGYITFGYKYNEGTEREWINEDFLSVNVGAESVPCVIWEITNALFRKCL